MDIRLHQSSGFVSSIGICSWTSSPSSPLPLHQRRRIRARTPPSNQRAERRDHLFFQKEVFGSPRRRSPFREPLRRGPRSEEEDQEAKEVRSREQGTGDQNDEQEAQEPLRPNGEQEGSAAGEEREAEEEGSGSEA